MNTLKLQPVPVIMGADPLLSQPTGIGHYTRELANALLDQALVADLKLFAFGKFFPQSLLQPITPVTTAATAVYRPTRFARARQVLSKSATVVHVYEKLMPVMERLRLQAHRSSVFHSPNFFVPNFSGPVVTTFHDLSTLKYPEFHPSVRRDFANKQLEIAVRSRAHIITDSDVIKREVIDTFGVAEERVTTVLLGAAREYRRRSAAECHAALESFAVNYGQFFLFVSTIEPRKNLLRLLAAYERYLANSARPLPFVIVGGEGWNSTAEHEQIQRLVRQGHVCYQGYVPQATLYQLYSAARAVLYPSIYEGFGLPALEALQSGVPVLTSRGTSMAEIVGDHAVLVDAHDEQAIYDGILRLAEDDTFCAELAAAGLKQAAEFSWHRCAQETAQVYRQLQEQFS